MKRIVASVTDKSHLRELEALTNTGEWEIISTGGTLRKLEELGIPCTHIEKITHFPEMLDGRVKTLHPNIFGGILADRSKPDHLAALAEHGIGLVDLVVVNLYNFAAKPSIDEIDIGGPSLLRAAAKNGASIAAVVDPTNYGWVVTELLARGSLTEDSREILAFEVFEQTSLYDAAIAEWMRRKSQRGEHFLNPTNASGH